MTATGKWYTPRKQTTHRCRTILPHEDQQQFNIFGEQSSLKASPHISRFLTCCVCVRIMLVRTWHFWQSWPDLLSTNCLMSWPDNCKHLEPIINLDSNQIKRSDGGDEQRSVNYTAWFFRTWAIWCRLGWLWKWTHSNAACCVHETYSMTLKLIIQQTGLTPSLPDSESVHSNQYSHIIQNLFDAQDRPWMPLLRAIQTKFTWDHKMSDTLGLQEFLSTCGSDDIWKWCSLYTIMNDKKS